MKDLHVSPRLWPLPKDTGQALIVTQYRGEPDFVFHFHPEYEIVLTLGSAGRRLVGSTITDYRDCDLVLLGPDIPHTWAAEPRPAQRPAMSNYVIHFTRDSLGQDFLSRREMKAADALLKRATRGLCFHRPAANPAIELMMRIPKLRGVARLGAFLSLLDHLAACREAEAIVPSDYDRTVVAQNHVLLGKVLEYIHRHSDRVIPLEEIAAHFRMSLTTFCRFFRRTTGRSFVDYVNDWRVSRACGLLKEDSLSILEICYSAGFHNVSHFNRQFRKRQGQTPRDYRRQWEQMGAASAVDEEEYCTSRAG